MPATRDLVNDLIAKDSIVIFSKSYCPYCKMAKEVIFELATDRTNSKCYSLARRFLNVRACFAQVFDKLKKKYTTIELDDREDAQEIQDVLGDLTGARTVPRVFLNGECLGGGTDVKKLFENGELEKKLATLVH